MMKQTLKEFLARAARQAASSRIDPARRAGLKAKLKYRSGQPVQAPGSRGGGPDTTAPSRQMDVHDYSKPGDQVKFRRPIGLGGRTRSVTGTERQSGRRTNLPLMPNVARNLGRAASRLGVI